MVERIQPAAHLATTRQLARRWGLILVGIVVGIIGATTITGTAAVFGLDPGNTGLLRLVLGFTFLSTGAAIIVGAMRSRTRAAYWLLIPGGLWLIIFYIVPITGLVRASLEEGTFQTGFEFAWMWDNFAHAFTTFRPQFVRSIIYGGTATAIALVVG